jgi:hypothetical protein
VSTYFNFDATTQSLSTTAAFLGATQNITIPANTTYKVIVISSRTFSPAAVNTATPVTMALDVGYMAGAGQSWSTSTGKVPVNAGNASSTGLQGLKLSTQAGGSSPSTVATIPATVAGAFTITNSTGSTATYTVGMIGSESSTTNGWSTNSGTITILVGQ